MKTILYNNPTFTPGVANAGTLNFSNYPDFQLNRLLAVIDQTTNTIIYAASNPGTGYFAYNPTSKVLTLQYNTAPANGYSSSDSLVCIYDYIGAANFVHTGASSASLSPVPVKASAGVLYGVHITPNKVDNGVGVYSAYLKIYNSTNAQVGSDTPVLTICIVDSAGVVPTTPNIPAAGLYFNTGISYAITANAAYTDTTLPQSGHVITLNFI